MLKSLVMPFLVLSALSSGQVFGEKSLAFNISAQYRDSDGGSGKIRDMVGAKIVEMEKLRLIDSANAFSTNSPFFFDFDNLGPAEKEKHGLVSIQPFSFGEDPFIIEAVEQSNNTLYAVIFDGNGEGSILTANAVDDVHIDPQSPIPISAAAVYEDAAGGRKSVSASLSYRPGAFWISGPPNINTNIALSFDRGSITHIFNNFFTNGNNDRQIEMLVSVQCIYAEKNICSNFVNKTGADVAVKDELKNGAFLAFMPYDRIRCVERDGTECNTLGLVKGHYVSSIDLTLSLE